MMLKRIGPNIYKDIKWTVTYFIPVLFNFNTPAFRKANGGSKPFRDYWEVIFLVMGNKWLNNECSYRCLATSHLNLKKIQYPHQQIDNHTYNNQNNPTNLSCPSPQHQDELSQTQQLELNPSSATPSHSFLASRTTCRASQPIWWTKAMALGLLARWSLLLPSPKP